MAVHRIPPWPVFWSSRVSCSALERLLGTRDVQEGQLVQLLLPLTPCSVPWAEPGGAWKPRWAFPCAVLPMPALPRPLLSQQDFARQPCRSLPVPCWLVPLVLVLQ